MSSLADSPAGDARNAIGSATRLPHLAVLAALMLTALVLRLVGLDFGLPHMLEQDTEIPNQVLSLRDGRDNAAIRRDFGTYPLLTAYATSLTSHPAPLYERSGDATLEEHLAAAGAPVLDVRRTVAWISVLLVPAAFFLARNFLGPWWSLLAAALVAFSTLHQSLSQQCRPHSVAAVFVALTLVAALRVVRVGSTAAYAWLGVAFCLAFGSLHSAVAVGPAIVCAHAVRAGWSRLLDWRLGLSLGLGALALPLFYPFMWAAQTNVVEEGKLTTGTHEIHASYFNGDGAGAVLRGLWFFEPLLLALLALALLVWMRRAWRLHAWSLRGPALVLAAYALPYLGALSLYGQTLDRFVIPLLPVLALFAVWGLQRLVAGLREHGRPALAQGLALLVVLGLALPVTAAAKLSWIRGQPDTLSEVADWLRTEGSGGPVFLAPRPLWISSNSAIDLPLGREAAGLKPPGGPARGLDLYNLWTRYQKRLADHIGPEPRLDLHWMWWRPKDVQDFVGPRPEFLAQHPWASFASTGPGLYVIEVFETRPKVDIIELRRALQRCGTLEVRFSPDRDPHWSELPQLYIDGQGDWPHVTLRLLQARAWGPVVEVYRVTEQSLEQARASSLQAQAPR